VLERPLSADELKAAAHALRGRSLSCGGNGAFKSGAAAAAIFPKEAAAFADFALAGPALNIEICESLFTPEAAAAICRRFEQPVLGAALVPQDSECTANGAIPAPPVVSFRAAALANMSMRPLAAGGDLSCEWEIGELYWLPAVRK
jgi:hypothetical protein